MPVSDAARRQLEGSRFGVGANCAEIVFSPEEDEWTGSCTGEVSASISGSPSPLGVQHGLLEEISSARAQVTKLKAAMAAVWESIATFSAPQEALKKAQEQAQVRPVEVRVASTKVFSLSVRRSGSVRVAKKWATHRRPWQRRRRSFRRVRVDRGRHDWCHSSRRPMG